MLTCALAAGLRAARSSIGECESEADSGVAVGMGLPIAKQVCTVVTRLALYNINENSSSSNDALLKSPLACFSCATEWGRASTLSATVTMG